MEILGFVAKLLTQTIAASHFFVLPMVDSLDALGQSFMHSRRVEFIDTVYNYCIIGVPAIFGTAAIGLLASAVRQAVRESKDLVKKQIARVHSVPGHAKTVSKLRRSVSPDAGRVAGGGNRGGGPGGGSIGDGPQMKSKRQGVGGWGMSGGSAATSTFDDKGARREGLRGLGKSIAAPGTKFNFANGIDGGTVKNAAGAFVNSNPSGTYSKENKTATINEQYANNEQTESVFQQSYHSLDEGGHFTEKEKSTLAEKFPAFTDAKTGLETTSQQQAGESFGAYANARLKGMDREEAKVEAGSNVGDSEADIYDKILSGEVAGRRPGYGEANETAGQNQNTQSRSQQATQSEPAGSNNQQQSTQSGPNQAEQSKPAGRSYGDMYRDAIIKHRANPELAKDDIALRKAAQDDAVRELYKPGNIVRGYGGSREKVLSFNEDGNQRNITVQEIDTAGNSIGAPRTHSGSSTGRNYRVESSATEEN